MVKRQINFVEEDFDPILRREGIDPDSVTEYEWSKFESAFCDGTHWSEVAGYAVDIIHMMRQEEEDYGT